MWIFFIDFFEKFCWEKFIDMKNFPEIKLKHVIHLSPFIDMKIFTEIKI